MKMDKRRVKIWEREGSIGVFTIPVVNGNYLEQPEFIPVDELEGYFNEPGLKGILIRGSGRHFSGGADLNNLRLMASDERLLFEKISTGKALLEMISTATLPVVAEIQGVCFGGGLEIALACHIRICSENALFAFPEVNLNLIPGLGGTLSLSRVIGQSKAIEMILSGDTVHAGRAVETGLANYQVPLKDLHEFSLNYIRKLTDDRDTEVIRAVMRSIQNAGNMSLPEALREETKLFCSLAIRNMNREDD